MHRLSARVSRLRTAKTPRSFSVIRPENKSFRRKKSVSKESRTFSSSSGPNEPPANVATIIQGPSLLANTGFHRPSPSIFFLPGLRSLPFWTAPPPPADQHNDPSKVSVAYNDPTITKIVKHLESNYETIKEEYMNAVMGFGTTTDMSGTPNVSKPLEPDYDVNKRVEHANDKLHIGNWDWHSYILNGQKQDNFIKACPKTAQILQDLQPNLFFDTQEQGHPNPFGFAFFSTLHGKSYIKPHTGPMNLRLRIHLPLIVPKDTKPDAYSTKPSTKCGLRVGDQIREWREGKAVVLDDSYEHEVWNETKDLRVLLLVDVWHPDVRMEERDRVGSMFSFAVSQGWMGNKEAPKE